MQRPADIWAKRKRPGGPVGSYYFRKTRLRTKDEAEARRRMKLLLEGKPLTDFGDAAGSDAGPDGGSSPPVSERGAGAPPVEAGGGGDWTADAPTAGPGAPAAAPGSPPGPSPDAAARAQADEENRQLSALVVAATFKGAELAAQKRVYEGFVPPPIAPAGRQMLESSWFQLLTYADIGSRLPPWVRQIVMPVAGIIGTTAYIFRGYFDLAAQQKARDGSRPATEAE